MVGSGANQELCLRGWGRAWHGLGAVGCVEGPDGEEHSTLFRARRAKWGAPTAGRSAETAPGQDVRHRVESGGMVLF